MSKWMPELTLTEYLQIIAAIWFTVLNIYLFKTASKFKRLTKDSSNLNLTQILDKIIKKTDLDEKRIEQISKDLARVEKLNQSSLQKFALIRFNPFEDTGGDQSFVLAILDANNNGLVISSLHTRNGTRVYSKQVASAKPVAHEFSKEEKEVVQKAAQS